MRCLDLDSPEGQCHRSYKDSEEPRRDSDSVLQFCLAVEKVPLDVADVSERIVKPRKVGSVASKDLDDDAVRLASHWVLVNFRSTYVQFGPLLPSASLQSWKVIPILCGNPPTVSSCVEMTANRYQSRTPLRRMSIEIPTTRSGRHRGVS